MSDGKIKVLCVDDHAFLVDGLRTRIEVERDLVFVGRLPSADDLIAEAKRLEPDIVLLDLEMPGIDPFEAIEDLRRACPKVRVIILSAFVRDRYIDLASQVGAWGYLSKSDAPDAIVEGVRAVARGDVAMSKSVRSRTSEGRPVRDATRSRLDKVTAREMHVLRLIAKGKARTEIAEELCISPLTVDNHRKALMRKLEINDRVELARFAIAEGLVEV